MIPGLWTDLLAFTLQLRKTPARGQAVDNGCVTSRRLKRCPLLPNEVGRIAQHSRKEEGRKEGKNQESERERERDRTLIEARNASSSFTVMWKIWNQLLTDTWKRRQQSERRCQRVGRPNRSPLYPHEGSYCIIYHQFNTLRLLESTRSLLTGSMTHGVTVPTTYSYYQSVLPLI